MRERILGRFWRTINVNPSFLDAEISLRKGNTLISMKFSNFSGPSMLANGKKTMNSCRHVWLCFFHLFEHEDPFCSNRFVQEQWVWGFPGTLRLLHRKWREKNGQVRQECSWIYFSKFCEVGCVLFSKIFFRE